MAVAISKQQSLQKIFGSLRTVMMPMPVPTRLGTWLIAVLCSTAICSARPCSTPGSARVGQTTGPSIPQAFQKALHKLAPVDETVQDHYGAEPAVAALEKLCGWNATTSTFQHADCLTQLGLSLGAKPATHFNAPTCDVHIVVPTRGDLTFLNDWKSVLYGYDFIIVQDGDPSIKLHIPAWVSYELYTRDNIDAALGSHSWIIGSKDESIRTFGFLVSNRTYVYTLDDDCTPAPDPHCWHGARCDFVVDALSRHMRNLRTPSTPHYFNTLYDPFLPGSDFAHGYPYSMRSGVPTVISHGLWLNSPNYDAPTQLLKMGERNQRYIETTITIPRGSFYPMCSMNVAFNRELIGATLMQALTGDGTPWGRYDDVFAGWASKACADHLGLGVKSGDPYILHNKASNPFTNLKKEYMGLLWQERLVAFFQAVPLSKEADNAEKCYLELADRMEAEFSSVSPYFARLAKAMRIWIHLWRQRSANKLHIYPSQTSRSAAALASTGRRRSAAVFTVVKNERQNLPIWLHYYARHFDEKDVYVIDNGSDDGSTDGLGVNVVTRPFRQFADHAGLVRIVQDFQQVLLDRYDYVLFAEVDELVVPNASKYAGGLREYIDTMTADTIRVTAFDLIHQQDTEADMDVSQQVLYQRSAFFRIPHYDKPLLTNRPLKYEFGFHRCVNCSDPQRDTDLLLVHIHRMDVKKCVARHEWKARQKFVVGEPHGVGTQNHLTGHNATTYCAGGNVGSEIQHRENVMSMLAGVPAEF